MIFVVIGGLALIVLWVAFFCVRNNPKYWSDADVGSAFAFAFVGTILGGLLMFLALTVK